MRFLALDFETANYYRDSACSIGLVKIRDGKVFKKAEFLIKPKTRWFHFTDLHGITYEDVRNEPNFEELWAKIRPFFRGVDYVVTHNAPFDRSVLNACCDLYGIEVPNKEFLCTVRLSRQHLNLYPTNLEHVCNSLKIRLKNHHNALDDAMACARIMMKIHKKCKGVY